MRHQPLQRWADTRLSTAIGALLHEAWVRGPKIVDDPDALVRRVRRLLDQRDGGLAISLGHGDPVFSNVLVTAGGGLALVDWEHAGHLPVAHDVAKVLVGVEDPEPVLDVVAQAWAPAAHPALDWREQVAVALCRLTGDLRGQALRAAAAGRRTRPYHRRLARRLRLIDVLTRG